MEMTIAEVVATCCCLRRERARHEGRKTALVCYHKMRAQSRFLYARRSRCCRASSTSSRRRSFARPPTTAHFNVDDGRRVLIARLTDCRRRTRHSRQTAHSKSGERHRRRQRPAAAAASPPPRADCGKQPDSTNKSSVAGRRHFLLPRRWRTIDAPRS